MEPPVALRLPPVRVQAAAADRLRRACARQVDHQARILAHDALRLAPPLASVGVQSSCCTPSPPAQLAATKPCVHTRWFAIPRRWFAARFAVCGRPTRVLVLTAFQMGVSWRSSRNDVTDGGHVRLHEVRLDFSIAELRHAIDPLNQWPDYVFMCSSSVDPSRWIVLATGNEPAFPDHNWQAYTLGMRHPRLHRAP